MLNQFSPSLQAMILAAGRGARMSPLTDHFPKPLQCVHGRPLIVWQIEALARAGFTDLVINCAWGAQALRAYVADGSSWGVRVRWSPEPTALGTAGGVANALDALTAPWFLVVSADIYTQYDYRVLASRLKRELECAPTSFSPTLPRSVSTTPIPPHAVPHLVLVADSRYPCDFALEGARAVLPHPAGAGGTYANIGLYPRHFFAALPPCTPADLGNLLREAARAGRLTGEWCTAPWENVGTVAELERLNCAWIPLTHEG